MRGTWLVFLDRDGTLVPDAGYMTRPEQLRLYPSVGPALRRLRGAGARLAVVSNQSVVARGGLDPAGLARMDRRLKALVREAGARLDRTEYCVHHPDFTGPCPCRKPGTLMIRRGLRAFGTAAADSFLIGDTASDLEAGRRAGLRTVLVLSGLGRVERGGVARRKLADHVARDLDAAARWILRSRGRD
jgi:histidinol-phosphate phosphatase family protein